MLPLLLARDIQQGIKQFLITGFEPADGFFHGVMRRFVDNEPAWMKGPYLQVGLPFRHDSAGRDFFSGFQTECPAYTHQREAWQRLASDRLAAHTLVATGTGSGKTECFVYPMLDHCARARQAGERGIKALVIYPMNALAMDQARRFARFIACMPAFHGLRVGLFVGGNVGSPGSGTLMSADSVITDRDTMRRHPPDILLTNYKMLDYLLLRRLQARLHSPEGHLICTGTSATLGDTVDTAPLREYARQVFGVPFDEHSVITESRLSAAEFLGDAAIEHVLQPRADLGTVLDPAQYTSPEAALAA
jgi:DEAD/DEAH box helicase domain-containing protein